MATKETLIADKRAYFEVRWDHAGMVYPDEKTQLACEAFFPWLQKGKPLEYEDFRDSVLPGFKMLGWAVAVRGIEKPWKTQAFFSFKHGPHF